jgi:type IV pilus assembly protein PilQ
MVLLGGLEEKKVSETTSGIPILSRIPILKWLFSSRVKENSFEKLNVFIKPTIIY